MREDIVSGTKRFVASAMKFGRKTVSIITLSGDRIDIAKPDGIPEGLQLPEDGTVLRNVAVSTNKAGDTLYGFYPAKGAHVVRFDSLASRKDADPMPKHVDAQPPKGKRTWWSPEKYIFTALLTVQTGDFAGCTIPWTLDYCFDRDVDGTTKFKGTKGQVERTREFMELCGCDTINDVIPYSENILPDLQHLLSQRADDYVFQVSMKMSEGGSVYVDEASELPAGFNIKAPIKSFEDMDADDADEEADDLVPPKKSRGEAVRELESDLVGELYGKKRADPDGEFEDDEDEEEEPPAPKAKRKAF